MVHLSGFEAVHYRGIDGLFLSPMTPVNLITGSNGVGKTALLEAIWLFGNRYSPECLWHPHVQRSGRPVVDPVAELSGGMLELHGVEDGSKHQWTVTFRSAGEIAQAAAKAIDNAVSAPVLGHLDAQIDGRPPVKYERYKYLKSVYLTPPGVVLYEAPLPPAFRPPYVFEGTGRKQDAFDDCTRTYSELVRCGLKDELTSAMRLMLPGLKEVEILAEKDDPLMLAVMDNGDELPVRDLGGGIERLFRLYLGIVTAHDGMVLVDEVENAVHYSLFHELWRHIRLWTKGSMVQFVATSQSAECIDAAIDAFVGSLEDLSIHKLFEKPDNGQVGVSTFTGELLEAVREMNWEVR